MGGENLSLFLLDSLTDLIIKLTWSQLTGERFNFIHRGAHKNMTLKELAKVSSFYAVKTKKQ